MADSAVALGSVRRGRLRALQYVANTRDRANKRTGGCGFVRPPRPGSEGVSANASRKFIGASTPSRRHTGLQRRDHTRMWAKRSRRRRPQCTHLAVGRPHR